MGDARVGGAERAASSSIIWTRPKRKWRAVLVGVDGTSYSVSPVTFKEIRKFLTLLKGRYRNFYIFDPAPQDYDAEEPEAFVGIWDGAWPMTTPFKGGTIQNIYKNGIIFWAGALSQFTQDDNGLGGEVRIVTVTTPGVVVGDEISVQITGAQQRIAAVSATER